MGKKICSSCKIEKELSEFNRNKNRQDGLQVNCRECCKRYKVNYYLKNKEDILDKSQKYYLDNKERIITRVKVWSDNNKEKTDEYKKKYVEENREKINKNTILRKKVDPIFKLKLLYRSRINKILGSKRENTFDLIGCSPSDLKDHLERQFKEGMTWENHGLYGWHIDHIIPLSSASNKKQLKELCHYTNLQPLWALENILKRDKII